MSKNEQNAKVLIEVDEQELASLPADKLKVLTSKLDKKHGQGKWEFAFLKNEAPERDGEDQTVVADAATAIKQADRFTETEDFCDDIEIDEGLGIIRVSGLNRKATKCPACKKFPINGPDKYLRIVKKVLMAKGKVIIEGMSTYGVGVAHSVVKEVRQDLNDVKVKTDWNYVDTSPFLIRDNETGFYQFGCRIMITLRKK